MMPGLWNLFEQLHLLSPLDILLVLLEVEATAELEPGRQVLLVMVSKPEVCQRNLATLVTDKVRRLQAYNLQV